MPLQQSGGIPAAHRRALIPASTMEFHVQRRWAASVFVGLQALKVMDFFQVFFATHAEPYADLFFKWILLDTGFFITLWVVQIPWLQLRIFKTALLVFLMSVLNMLLFAVPLGFIPGLFMKGVFTGSLSKLTSVSQGRPVSVKDIINNSSHILGRHTVHILPYGTAKLNPNDEVYCLPSNEIGKKDIHIPIILNNTAPRTITIQRYDFDGSTSTKDYSGSKIQRATEIGHAKEGVEYYYIKVRKPGVYKLDKIISKDGVDVRLYNRQVFVLTCPYAHFKPVEAKDYCTGEKESLEIEVMGVPPLKIEYKTNQLDSRAPEKTYKLSRIQPDGFESPLQRLPGGLKAADPAFFSTSQETYHWAAVQHLPVAVNISFYTAEKVDYKLSRVIDGAGNEVDLSHLNHQAFTVHGRPQVKFQCGQTDPVNLLIGSKSTYLPLHIEGSGPFQLEYKYAGDHADKEQLYKAKLGAHENSVSVSSPGEYNLVSISDKYCTGQVLFPSSCLVVQPELPLVKLTSTSIPSECAGDNEIGMKFVAEFVGAPPYVLEYSVTKQNGRSKTVIERKREVIDRSRHIFTYLPSSSGEYIYEFNSLDDRHYKKRPTQIAPIKQIVHPQPDAKFSSNTRRSVRTCLGEDLSVNVDLRGTGPFTLSWTVGKQLYSDVVEGDKYTINLPPFDHAGHHVVSLVKIQDANECVKELEARDFTIDVRRDRPTAFFYTNNEPVKTIEVTEGSVATLPIRLTGEGPWTVAYRHVESGDRSKTTKRFTDPNAFIEVTEPGHYELLHVEDSICKGDVLTPQYLVQHLAKPTIALREDQAIELAPGVYERSAVCQGAIDAIDVDFTGYSPFHCSYREYISTNAGRSFQLLSTEDLTASMNHVHLPLKTREAGKYRYVFDKLSDERYTTPFKIGILQLEQMVHATPLVRFSSKSQKERSLCVGESLDSAEMDPIYLEFQGVAPFTVEVGVRLQSELQGRIIKVDDIMTKRYKLSLPEELKESGTYHITLLTVNDANGCGAEVPRSADTTLSIKALEIATLAPATACDDVCVGDNLEFNLFGVSPFTVQYLFNDKSETVKSQGTKLTMIADKPGNLTILSVGDQRNKCRSFPKDISRQIHEVPSSIVSGGKEIIENIREGDMVQAVVDFVGTPPFDFEWRRSRLIWDNQRKTHYKGEVLESHMVYGVEEYRYLINTSVEGVIEVVSIKDRFCQYPN